MWKILLQIQIILMILGFASTSPDNAPGKIIGGEIVDIKDYPYQVSVRVAVGDKFYRCGGSIITEEHILTTASCTKKYIPSTIRVRVGSSFRNKGGFVHRVHFVYIHPDFDMGTKSHDISILRLSSLISFDSTAQPINLPTADSEIVDGTNATATGWSRPGPKGSAQLQMVTMSTISNKKCSKLYGRRLLDTQLCAGYDGKTPCIGDLGGPLVASGVQIGVTSWTTMGKPSIFTKVSKVRNWIDEIIIKKISVFNKY